MTNALSVIGKWILDIDHSVDYTMLCVQWLAQHLYYRQKLNRWMCLCLYHSIQFQLLVLSQIVKYNVFRMKKNIFWEITRRDRRYKCEQRSE
jgi:hypothetical protein